MQGFVKEQQQSRGMEEPQLAFTECMVQAAPDVLSRASASARLLTSEGHGSGAFPDVASVACAAYFLTGAVLVSLQHLARPTCSPGLWLLLEGGHAVRVAHALYTRLLPYNPASGTWRLPTCSSGP